MDAMIEFLTNSAGTYDLGSIIKLLGMMVAIDGIVLIIYAILKGANGR